MAVGQDESLRSVFLSRNCGAYGPCAVSLRNIRVSPVSRGGLRLSLQALTRFANGLFLVDSTTKIRYLLSALGVGCFAVRRRIGTNLALTAFRGFAAKHQNSADFATTRRPARRGRSPTSTTNCGASGGPLFRPARRPVGACATACAERAAVLDFDHGDAATTERESGVDSAPGGGIVDAAPGMLRARES